jgi:hypothetical protein
MSKNELAFTCLMSMRKYNFKPPNVAKPWVLKESSLSGED